MRIPDWVNSMDELGTGDDPYRFGVDFVCTECDRKFFVRDYDGRWDHAGEPICPACAEEE